MGFMKKKGLYHFLNVLLILAVTFLAVSGCSSDDDNNSGSDPLITYSGITDPVTITVDNAMDMVAWSAPMGTEIISLDFRPAQPVSGENIPNDLTTRSMQSGTNSIGQFGLYTMISDAGLRVASVSESDTENCAGGGTNTVTLTYEDETRIDFTLSFYNCVDEDGITMAGTGSNSIIDDTNTYITNLTDLVFIKDDVYVWRKNYTITEVYSATGLTQVTSGQFYVSGYGYATVSTEEEFVIDTDATTETGYAKYPNAGVLLVTGAGGTKARLTAAADTYTIDIDTGAGWTFLVSEAWSNYDN